MQNMSEREAIRMEKRTEKHPSGLTWERWDWPFKTFDERKLVAKYFERVKRQENKEAKQQIYNSEQALL
jgi:hypothetical protein